MTARDEAVDAGIAKVKRYGTSHIGAYWLGLALDGMPDDVLVDLLVERGVLEPVTLPHGNHTTHTYQRKDQ